MHIAVTIARLHGERSSGPAGEVVVENRIDTEFKGMTARIVVIECTAHHRPKSIAGTVDG